MIHKKLLRLSITGILIVILLSANSIVFALDKMEWNEELRLRWNQRANVYHKMDYNLRQLLTRNQVVKILKANGYDLKALDHSVNLAKNYVLFDVKPSIYTFNNQEKIQVLIYQFKGYPDIHDLKTELASNNQHNGQFDENYMVYGKNIVMMFLSDDSSTENLKLIKQIGDDIFQIMCKEAFDGQGETYIGEGNYWKVTLNSSSYLNLRVNKVKKVMEKTYCSDLLPELVYKNENQENIKVKDIKILTNPESFKEDERVVSIRWIKDNIEYEEQITCSREKK